MFNKKVRLIPIWIALFLTSCISLHIKNNGIDQGFEIFKLSDHTTLGGIVWSPDNTEIGFTNFDPGTGVSKVMILDLQTKRISEPLGTLQATAGFDGWTPTGQVLFDSNGKINTFDPKSKEISFIRNGIIAAWSRDGEKLAVVDSDSGVVILDLEKGTESLYYKRDINSDIYGLSWSPTNKSLAFSVDDRATHKEKIVMLDLETKMSSDLVRSTRIFSPTWSPDGNQLAYLSIDDQPNATIIISNLKNDCLNLDTGGTWSLAWSPDGKYLAYSLNQSIYLIASDKLGIPTSCEQ
jgi:WD40 repeat protein